MLFADTTINNLFTGVDLVYFTFGVVIFLAVSKIWRGGAAKETNNQALSTITILKANIEAVEKQAATEKQAYERVIQRLEKQLDDTIDRGKKLEEQVKNLSIIPWDRQQDNHREVMDAIAAMSMPLTDLVTFLRDQNNTTTIKGGGKVVVEPSK